jgi:hypothetical protein
LWRSASLSFAVFDTLGRADFALPAETDSYGKIPHLRFADSLAIERLRSVGTDTRIDLWLLLNPFMVLAERYVAAFFSPQEVLFPAPGGKEDERWSRYFHHVLRAAL